MVYVVHNRDCPGHCAYSWSCVGDCRCVVSGVLRNRLCKPERRKTKGANATKDERLSRARARGNEMKDMALEGAAYPFFAIGWMVGMVCNICGTIWDFCWGGIRIGFRTARGVLYDYRQPNSGAE